MKSRPVYYLKLYYKFVKKAEKLRFKFDNETFVAKITKLKDLYISKIKEPDEKIQKEVESIFEREFKDIISKVGYDKLKLVKE